MIEEKIDLVVRQITSIHGDVSEIFDAPAESSDLSLIKSAFQNEKSIADISTLYKRFNGQRKVWAAGDSQDDDSIDQPTFWTVVLDGEIVDSMYFHSIREMIDTHSRMDKLMLESGEYYCEGADEGIDPVFWSSDWIPFGSSPGGDLICLDPKSGAVIYVCHEGGKRKIIADSWESFFDLWAKCLRETVVIKETDDDLSVTYKDLNRKISSIEDFPWKDIPDRADIQAFHIKYGFFPLENVDDFF